MKEQQWLEDGWFFHNHAWHLLHEIIKLIPDDCESLLDCGAGTGIAAAIIRAIRPEMSIRVTDVEKGCVKFWQKRDLLGYVIQDENLPISDNYHDFVMSSHVLEHVNDPVLFVSEMIRVAKKRVVIVVPDGDCHIYDHKTIYNRTNFLDVLTTAYMKSPKAYEHVFINTFPVYHQHINNLVGVIDL